MPDDHEARFRRYKAVLASLAQTLRAIKDMLNRHNGH
jgi:hypothetical protein